MASMENSTYEIRCAGEKGRGLFSLMHLSKNDIIFEEEPIVSCQFAWNQDYGYKACDHCLRPLESAQENARRLAMCDSLTIPYPEKCTVDKTKHVTCHSCNVQYCSTECQELAWNNYHKTFCLQAFESTNKLPLNVLKETWKEMHYPPETSSIILFARIFAMIHQAEDKSAILNIIEDFCHPSPCDKDISCNLFELKFADGIEILREQLLNCIPTEMAPQWITPDGFRSLVTLVGMNGQGIGTSAVSDWVRNIKKMNLEGKEKEALENFIDKLYVDFDNAVGEFLNNEGSGLYPLQSRINHSCRPNAEIAFPNSNYRLAVRCTEDIPPGVEICISYLEECVLDRSRRTRQNILKSNYFFDCKCPRCEDELDQPDEMSEEETEDEDEDEDEE